jgi:hypothetical protein
MRNAKCLLSGVCLAGVVAALAIPTVALALHRESPPAIRLTNADSHAVSTGRSWGNWVAFSSTQDLANLGAARYPGRQIFVYNQAFYDCANNTTGVFAAGFCPPAGTPYLIQVTNGPGNPDNPSAGDKASGAEFNDIWVAFDADGRFNCGTNATCLASAQATRRQIFIKNIRTNELKQVTASGSGDSTHPSGNIQLGVIGFESTAALAGFPNPAGVPQVYVFQRICNSAGSGNCGVSAPVQLSIGPAPNYIIPLGASGHPTMNESGTAIAFQSRADLLGSGVDTGRYQIFEATYDKKLRKMTGIVQVTHGNASSTNPYIGIRNDGTSSPDDTTGTDTSLKKTVLLFESSATDLPGILPGSGSQIIEALLGSDNLPTGVLRQHTTTGIYGECHFPVTDASGNRVGFVCTGDPLQNGTTGNRAFVLDRTSQTLYQITGAGDVQGPIALNVGQWFLTVSTTSDLTNGGSCGYQIYVVDYYQGKWAAATALGQVPADAIGGGGTTAIGFRNFELQTGTATGGSQLVIATKDGTTATPITSSGRIGLIIGAPDDIFHETTVTAKLNRLVMPAVPVPGYGAFCFSATDDGAGALDCDGGKLDGSITTTRDHVTDDSDYACKLGCRDDDPTCNGVLTGAHLYACPTCAGGVCNGGPNAGLACATDQSCQNGMACVQCPICDTTVQRCVGGPQDGQSCSTDATCQFGVLCNVEKVCVGPDQLQFSGTYSAGGLRVSFPIRVSIATSPGADDAWCTADDLYSPVKDVDTTLRLTTENATATIQDADPLPGVATGAITDTETGAPFSCDRLATGDLAGARLVGSVPLLNVQTVSGFKDMVLSFRFEPKADTASSCSAFCLSNADCDDGDVCNGTETCQANRCTPGTPLVCDDNNACNGVETCDATLGCQAGVTPNCDDANVCTTDSCDTTLGCVHVNNTNACDDGSLCTTGDVCAGGVCTGTATNCSNGLVCDGAEFCDPADGTCKTGTALNCDDGNPCTTDSCSEAGGGCQHTPVADGTACSDGNLCTTGDSCQAGACQGAPVVCTDPDANVCTGVPSCDPADGVCKMGAAPICDDGNACTADTCEPTAGCEHTPLSGTTCSDGNACTSLDTCVLGTCVGTPVVCTDLNACNGVETCNPATGCVAGTPVNCDDNNPCTADSCDAVTGACSHVPLTGVACNDNSACTSGDTCQLGICKGTPIVCDDNNACNGLESCDPSSGCVAGTPLDCDDGNTCTNDSCDAVQGCVNAPLPNGTVCNDSDLCTVNDTCQSGICTGLAKCDDGNACNGVETCNPLNGACGAGTSPNCDDGNACTDDSCQPAVGCVNSPNTDPCNDGNACTTGDVCTNGTCQGAPLTCGDNNVCNGVETCDPAIGCLTGAAPNCDDGDSCTADSCDAVLGCVHTALPNFLVCRANAFAAAVLGTPAENLGGVRKKQKLVRMSSTAVKLVQKSLTANPRQSRANLKSAERTLQKATRLLQRFEDKGIISKTIGDGLLNLASSAAQAIEAN